MAVRQALTFGSLFAGVGGIDLGLEWAGMECRWQVEIDEWNRQQLARLWPDVRRFGDVRDCGAQDLEWVDLIAGGFPCQPVSLAGQQQGVDDPRWLWPEFARVIRLLRPRYVLVENTPGLLSVNRGRAIREVLGDLAALGYDAEWETLPAAAVGAPHLRFRVFLLAYTRHERGRNVRPAETGETGEGGRPTDHRAAGGSGEQPGHVADSSGPRRRQDSRSTHENEAPDEGRATTQANEPDRDGEGHRSGHVADADSRRQLQQSGRGRQIPGRSGNSSQTLENTPRQQLEESVDDGREDRGRSHDQLAGSGQGGRASDVSDAVGSGRRTLDRLRAPQGSQPDTQGSGEALTDAVGRRRTGQSHEQGQGSPERTGAERGRHDMADSEGVRMEGNGADRFIFPPAPLGPELLRRYGAASRGTFWPAEPRVGDLAHGLPADLVDPEWGAGWRDWPIPRMVEESPERRQKLMALGNAVLPQVAEFIGLLIRQFDEGRQDADQNLGA